MLMTSTFEWSHPHQIDCSQKEVWESFGFLEMGKNIPIVLRYLRSYILTLVFLIISSSFFITSFLVKIVNNVLMQQKNL